MVFIEMNFQFCPTPIVYSQVAKSAGIDYGSVPALLIV
jgi:hypothetical protein